VVERDDVIRASEISQYSYCARAWWFRRVLGYGSANLEAMRRGTAQHRVHGRRVERYHRLRWLAVGLLTLAGVALIAWLLLGLLG
jgi:CRISPR/Cas system-associated exonuclease Cas4 (RecB family)